MGAERSVAHRINRETVVLLGWGRAILLQFAHPLIAAAVAEHSHFGEGLRSYLTRAHRTIGAMLQITFGTQDEARAVIDRINAIHRRVHGTLSEAAGPFGAATPYSARDPRLLRWVHATLLDSLPLAYELFVGPLSREDKDAFCAEAAGTAALLGVDDDVPLNRFDDVQQYVRQMLASGELHIGDHARSLAAAVLRPPLGAAVAPLFFPARLTTAGLLPPPIRAAYGFHWDSRREWWFRKTAALIRHTRPFVPSPLRELPGTRQSLRVHAAVPTSVRRRDPGSANRRTRRGAQSLRR